jgi:hypothetical protein
VGAVSGGGGASDAVPAQWFPASGAVPARPADIGPTEVVRDGARWRIGTAADIAWIASSTTVDATITSAIPAVFDAYATLVLPGDFPDQLPHDEALLSTLRRYAGGHWWLGYLDTGADDVVFPEAPRVSLYSGWPYVLVQAGPEQAATWRRWEAGSFWSGGLPNLMFPADHSWLVSTLWDDDWTCVGGPASLVEDLLTHPELRSCGRLVGPGENATPPGHQSI